MLKEKHHNWNLWPLYKLTCTITANINQWWKMKWFGESDEVLSDPLYLVLIIMICVAIILWPKLSLTWSCPWIIASIRMHPNLANFKMFRQQIDISTTQRSNRLMELWGNLRGDGLCCEFTLTDTCIYLEKMRPHTCLNHWVHATSSTIEVCCTPPDTTHHHVHLLCHGLTSNDVILRLYRLRWHQN